MYKKLLATGSYERLKNVIKLTYYYYNHFAYS